MPAGAISKATLCTTSWTPLVPRYSAYATQAMVPVVVTVALG
jgi:hypothetical protein